MSKASERLRNTNTQFILLCELPIYAYVNWLLILALCLSFTPKSLIFLLTTSPFHDKILPKK